MTVWPGMSLWIGQALEPVTVHAHHAIQVTLALSGTVRLRSAASPVSSPMLGAVVASDHPHTFDGRGATVAMIFVEPESPLGRALHGLCREAGAAELDGARAAEASRLLTACWAGSQQRAELIAAAEAAVQALAAQQPSERAPFDARIARAIDLIGAQLAQPLRIGTIARAVHLSPGRLRHLFVEQTGVTFRGYVLWQRMQLVLHAIEAGSTLTEAAHAAGFADSAHLTRTFRRMFGTAPSGIEVVQR